ncbi:hypothetical protein ScalyP_jg1245 [Parmales sp. scaly parma]|nr:hypothetical protein ScalyP_jg1245 [Parmales sp. scaly parma]
MYTNPLQIKRVEDRHRQQTLLAEKLYAREQREKENACPLLTLHLPPDPDIRTRASNLIADLALITRKAYLATPQSTNPSVLLLPSKEHILLGIEIIDTSIKNANRNLERARAVQSLLTKNKLKCEKEGKRERKRDEDEEKDTNTLSSPNAFRRLTKAITTQNFATAASSSLLSQKHLPILTKLEVVESATREMKSDKEWGYEARFVSGPSDALYNEPMANPLWGIANERYIKMRHHVSRIVFANSKALRLEWESLAEKYVEIGNRFKEEEVERKVRQEEGERIRAATVTTQSGGNTPTGGGFSRRGSSGGGRRGGGAANQGDFISSEYDQELFIAKLVAEEKMAKRIKFGVCSKLPRQVVLAERNGAGLMGARNVVFVETGRTRRIVDSQLEQNFANKLNPWSDTEKCIYLDKFCSFPKNFKKISTYLRNKDTGDCIAHYYNSKNSIKYKHLLREAAYRRRARETGGVSTNTRFELFKHTVEAVTNCGGSSVFCERTGSYSFELPEGGENAFSTIHFHPPRYLVMGFGEGGGGVAFGGGGDVLSEPATNNKKRNFYLDTKTLDTKKRLKRSL